MMQKISCLTLLLLIFQCGFSQIDYKTVIPPSPQTAEFEKYIKYNVSLATGVPEISIPLYTIHLKGLDVPVSLSYHASGIKYHQDNGDVGVGWVLNPGYRISRTIYGLPDDWYSMPPDLGDSASLHSGIGLDEDKFYSQFIDTNATLSQIPHMEDFHNHHLDGEYDLFNYSLPSMSGSFLIMDRANKIVQMMDKSNVSVNYSKGLSVNSAAYGILNYDVLDDKGNKYLFGEHSSSDQNVYETPPTTTSLVNSWAMTKIITAFGDQLNFKYSPKFVRGWAVESRTEVLKSSYSTGGNIYPVEHDPAEPGFPGSYESFMVNEISNSREKVVLQRNDQGFITSLIVYTSGNSIVKSVNFFYSSSSDPTGWHTFLDSIKINDNNSNPVQTYKFGYNTGYPQNPGITGIDQWGYYLAGSNRSTDLHNEFQNIRVYLANGGSDFVYNYIAGFTDRSRSISNPPTDYYTLNSITYPTGGKTKYEYESNQYLENGVGPVRQGGGIRIARISSYDGSDYPTLIRDYTYSDGVPQVLIDYRSFMTSTAYVGAENLTGALYLQGISTYSTQMQGDVGATGATSSFVCYPTVTETLGDYGATNGKIVHKYKVAIKYDVGDLTFPSPLGIGYNYIINYNYPDDPQLLEDDYYASDGSLVKKDLYDYYLDIDKLTGLKVRNCMTSPEASDAQYPDVSALFPAYFVHSTYTIEYGRYLLTNKKVITYQGGRPITENTDFEYNTHDQVIKTTTYQSDGTKRLAFSTYPFDYSNGSGFIDAMVARNIVSSPIEQVTCKEDGVGNVKVLHGLITEYKSSNASLPESILAIENDSPVPLTSFKFSNQSPGVLPGANSGFVFSPDASYKTKLTFDKYDAYSNLIQQTKVDNITKAYLWDYQNTLPICEVVNADSNSIAYTSFEADGLGNWNVGSLSRDNLHGLTGHSSYPLNSDVSKSGLNSSTTYFVSYWSSASSYSIPGTIGGYPLVGKMVTVNGVNWRYYEHKVLGQNVIQINGAGGIDELRLYPATAQMTTYTHDPLIGVTSQCDINNRITYYSYDAFHRLSVVKDQDGNIIKTIDYHYKGQ